MGLRVDKNNEEEMMFQDVIQQMIKEKTTTAYVYNKNIVDRLQKEMPNLEIKHKDFYWTVRRKDVNKRPLTKKRICEELYISRPTLDNWLKLGCPYHIVGGRKYFMIDEVEEWIKSK